MLHPMVGKVRDIRRWPALLLLFSLTAACSSGSGDDPADPPAESTARSSRLALWLAKKDELTQTPDADFDLVMTGWVEPAEAQTWRERNPSVKILAGLTHTWVFEEPAWINLLISVANGGDTDGPLQITPGMRLGFDEDGDGIPETPCSPPGWPQIHAIDPRHPDWRGLIRSFYRAVGEQPQHDGVIVDMVDAYPFCEGAFSPDLLQPLDSPTWVEAQSELLADIRGVVPEGKWIIANAGRDFPEGSPFLQYLNDYLLENYLGEWGLPSVAAALNSAQRAMESTRPPHIVVFAADTNNTGNVDFARLRTGYASHLLMDSSYFAYDFGPRDHGGVADWWFDDLYQLHLGDPLGPYKVERGVYSRKFEYGEVYLATDSGTTVEFASPHEDIVDGQLDTRFDIESGDARIYLRSIDGTPSKRSDRKANQPHRSTMKTP